MDKKRKREKEININGITLYHCIECNSFRPEEKFEKRSDNNKLRSMCRDCRRKDSFTQYRFLRKGIPQEVIEKEWQEWEKIESDKFFDIKRSLLYSARNRAKQKNLEFNLDFNDIIIPEKCPLLDKQFIHKDSDYTYSIDRIDNSKGYVKGNISIISKLANTMKNKTSEEELISFANNIKKYIKI